MLPMSTSTNARNVRDFSHGFAGLAQTLLCTMARMKKSHIGIATKERASRP